MYTPQSDEDDRMPDRGRALSKWDTFTGLNRSALDNHLEENNEEFSDAALGISSPRRTASKIADGGDSGSVCVVVGARVPGRQCSPWRQRRVSPGRNFSPGRHLSPGRNLSPGRHLSPRELSCGRLEVTDLGPRGYSNAEVLYTGPDFLDKNVVTASQANSGKPAAFDTEWDDGNDSIITTSSRTGRSRWAGCNTDGNRGGDVGTLTDTRTTGDETSTDCEEPNKLTAGHKTHYHRLERAWSLYASQQELDTAGLASPTPSHSYNPPHSSSQKFSHSDNFPSCTRSSSSMGSRSKLSGKCDSEDSVASDVFEQNVTSFPTPGTDQCKHDHVDYTEVVRERTQSEIHEHHSEGDDHLKLVPSLRRARSKSESAKSDDGEKAHKPSKSVHFSIFPYVREIPGTQFVLTPSLFFN